MEIFLELSLVVFITTICALIIRRLKQPLIVSYIVAGILVGPYVFNIFTSTEYVELFSKIGISILLFIVGLSLNPESLREVGKTSLITGLGQVLFTSVVGYFIGIGLGLSSIEAIYVAIALTFSSTIIILKLLSDKGDVNKLYGRVSIGFLLVQDFVATIILLLVTFFGSSNGENSLLVSLLLLVLKGSVVAGLIYYISIKILPSFSRAIASNQEMLFLFSIAWGLGLASVFTIIGFSMEIGALVAGIALSVSPFSYEIASRLKPLRDFFIILFFVLLGSQMVFENFASILIPAIVLSLFVLIGNPIIVFVIMNIMGFKRRTSFEAGLTVAQISEFSLILVALGLTVGHISQDIVSLVTLVGVITIAGSTYLIMYSGQIFHKLEPMLRYLEIRKKKSHEPHLAESSQDMIIFGYDRVGGDFVDAARRIGARYLVVDYSPVSIKRLQQAEIPFRFGDASDTEFLQEIHMVDARLVVSTVPDYEINMLLVKMYRKSNPDGIIIVISHSIAHTSSLYLAGASYVVMPHHLGAHHASLMIERYKFDHTEFDRERNIHLAKLAKKHDYVKRVI